MVCSGVLHSYMSYGDGVPEYTKPIVGFTSPFISVKAPAVSACINQGVFSYH